MPSSENIPLVCPRCKNDVATLFVNSPTILTVTCGKCGHTWTVALSEVPVLLRRTVQLQILERYPDSSTDQT